MEPKFGTSGEDGELLCPACGGNYLHHERIEVFDRGEDQSYGVHVTIDDGKAIVDTCLDGNPSPRRHGISIRFLCENCSAKGVFTLIQHKGNTYLRFDTENKM